MVGDLNEGKPPISVKFEIPYFTTSGIQVHHMHGKLIHLLSITNMYILHVSVKLEKIRIKKIDIMEENNHEFRCDMSTNYAAKPECFWN